MGRRRTSSDIVPVARGAPAGVVAPPVFRSLSRATCLALLKRHVVGRMAHSFHDRVDITPIHYVYANGWLHARTSHGAKLTTIGHSPWVAFEVDEVDGLFDWRSVVVHGAVYTEAPDGGPVEARRWSRGIELLRALIPQTGTPDDPVAFRDVVFGIHVDTITGRAATTARMRGGTPLRATPGVPDAATPTAGAAARRPDGEQTTASSW